MAALQIILNQAGSPPGVAGDAREDLVTGAPFQVSLQGGPFAQYLWTLSDKPIDHVAGVQSAAGVLLPQSATTPIQPIDVEGSYLIQAMVDSGQGLGATPADIATLIVYAGTPLSALADQLPQREPAFGERLEYNVLDPILALKNFRGWAQTMGKWFVIIRAAFRGSARTWARVHLTNAGASIVMMSNVASVTRVSVGIVDVTFIRPQPSINYGTFGSARGATGGSVDGYNEGLSTVRFARADQFGVLVDADFTFGILSS